MKLPFRSPAPCRIHTAPMSISRIPTTMNTQRIYPELRARRSQGSTVVERQERDPMGATDTTILEVPAMEAGTMV